MRSLPFSQSLAVSTIGTKLMNDAASLLESRRETTGALDEELSFILSKPISSENLEDMMPV